MASAREVLSIVMQAKNGVTPVTRAISRSLTGVGRVAGTVGRGITRSFRGVAGAVGAVLKPLALVGSLVAALGVSLSIGGLVTGIKSVADEADRVSKLSDQLAATTTGIQRLTFVAKISGIEFNELAKGMQNVSRRIAEARDGTGEGVDALRDLGLSVERLIQLPADKQLEAVLDSLRGVENQTERVKLAYDLFGRSGTKLVQILATNTEGVKELGDEAERLGAVLSADELAGFVRLQDAIARIQTALRGAIATIGIQLAPTVSQFFEDAAAEVGRFSTKVRDVFTAIRTALEDDESDIAGAIQRSLSDSLRAAQDVGRATGTAFLVALATTIVVSATKVVGRIGRTIGREIAAQAIESAGNVIANVYEALGLDALARDTREGILGVFDLIEEDGRTTATRLANAVAGAAGDVTQALRALPPLYQDAIEPATRLRTAFGELAAAGAAMADEVTKSAKGVQSELRAAFRFEDFVTGFEDAQTEAAAGLLNLAEAGKSAFNSIRGTVTGSIDRAFDSIVDGTFDARAAFRDMAKDVIVQIGKIAARLAAIRIATGLFGGAFGTAGGGSANSASLFIAGAANGGVVPGPVVPAFANGGITPGAGGIVDRARLFVAGEGKFPEAVVPLPDGRRIPVRMQGGGGTIVNNYYSINAIDTESFDARLQKSEGLIGEMGVKRMTQRSDGRAALRSVGGR